MNKITFRGIRPLEFNVKEAYNTLRTNIQFCGKDAKVIALTSCLPDEGKSTIVFRLSQSMAGAGKKVLLLDVDIRRSVLLNRYRANKSVKGLSEYLSDQCELGDVVYNTNVENMDVIFTGPVAPNPSELLGNANMDTLLAYAKENYDYTFIDCPPLGAVIDAAIIAQKCDGAILVVGSKMVSRKLAGKVKKQLEQAQVKILGAILNKVDMEGKSKYNGYYNSYYGKANDIDQERKAGELED